MIGGFDIDVYIYIKETQGKQDYTKDRLRSLSFLDPLYLSICLRLTEVWGFLRQRRFAMSRLGRVLDGKVGEVKESSVGRW
jgi:hypothetical protein